MKFKSWLNFRSPQPAPRSVVFLNHAYYNFLYLSKALRDRGWDAVTVNFDSPESNNSLFNHGHDICLYHPKPEKMRAKAKSFLEIVKRKYKMVHFYGIGRMSFFADNWDGDIHSKIPWDFLELKKLGIKIGYSHCGCRDMVSQTTFNKWSGGCCNKCIWQTRPDVCSDLSNLSWGHKVQTICDLISTETEPSLDYKSGPKIYKEPLTFAIDKDIWHPDFEIPKKYLQPKSNDEILIYHGFGNMHLRSNSERNIKGTPAILTAVDRLKMKGYKVRLLIVSDVPSSDVRFYQAQADIIIDQLNYGRYGANAREGMMLGRPTICLINQSELIAGTESECMKETPLINANENTIEGVLEHLIKNKELREKIGEESRRHAIKWWSAEACAANFELVFDRLQAGLPPSDKPHPSYSPAVLTETLRSNPSFDESRRVPR